MSFSAATVNSTKHGPTSAMHCLKLLLSSRQFTRTVAALALSLSGPRELGLHQMPLCCFGLQVVRMAGTDRVQKDPRHITFGRPAVQSVGKYCLDLDTSRLIGRGDAEWRQTAARESTIDPLYCSTESHSHLSYTVATQADGKQYLVGDGFADFLLNPNAVYSGCILDGAQPATRTALTGIDKPAFRLFLTASTQSRNLVQPEHANPGPDAADIQATSKRRLLEPRDMNILESADVPDPSITCSTSSASPSLAPAVVFVGDAFDTNMVLEPSPNFAAAISPTQTSAFQFHIPGTWRGLPKCALYFRLPYCSELPDGFPCYNFSGLEQEYVNNAGMVFVQIQDVPPFMNWRQQSLVQVAPGYRTVVGTFDCSAGADEGDGKSLYWLVKSQNHFLLQYMQPDQNRHVDNMGLWVVACDS